MALQQVVPISMLIEGDGSSTVFIFALGNLYQISSGSAVPYGNLGAVPTGIVVSGIPPVPVTSVTIDGVGNITITLASALGAGIVLNFVFNLLFNSGDVSTFPAATLISGTVGISNFPVSQAVTLASTTITGTVGVTGAFFQATQPISGAISFTAPQHVINDASAAVIGHVINDASAAVIGHVISDTGSVVAVSNFPASQVVTLASTTITGNVAVTGAFFQATQPVSVVSGTLTSVTAITNALPAGTNVLGHIIVDSGTITAVTAIINALPTGANTIGKVDILGNAGATLDAAINGAASTNALWAMHAPSTAAAAAMATPTTIAALTVANVKASAGNVYGEQYVGHADLSPVLQHRRYSCARDERDFLDPLRHRHHEHPDCPVRDSKFCNRNWYRSIDIRAQHRFAISASCCNYFL